MMQKPLDSRKPSPRPIEQKPKGLEQSWFADFLLLGVFLGVIFLGLATYWFGQDREVSVLEGRQLAQQPDVSRLGQCRAGWFLYGRVRKLLERPSVST